MSQRGAACASLAASTYITIAAVSTVLAGAEFSVVKPASQPAAGERMRADPEWERVLDDLRKHNLPTDIPLPWQTPYDADPAKRERYLDGYRFGFADGILFNHSDFFAREPFWQGLLAGRKAGGDLFLTRSTADSDRRSGFIFSGREINDRSSASDREIRKSFQEFRQRLLTTIRRDFPPALQASEKEAYWTVYRYPYKDYSASNTGEFVAREGYKGICTIVLSVAPDATEDVKATELKGRYHLHFEFSDGHWVWEQTWGLERQVGRRNQQMVGGSAEYEVPQSSVPAERIRAAIRAADAMAATQPSR